MIHTYIRVILGDIRTIDTSTRNDRRRVPTYNNSLTNQYTTIGTILRYLHYLFQIGRPTHQIERSGTKLLMMSTHETTVADDVGGSKIPFFVRVCLGTFLSLRRATLTGLTE